jgi:putative colanic acid biosynthesis acetyltransferase WcaF
MYREIAKTHAQDQTSRMVAERTNLDVQRNVTSRKYSPREQFWRLAWFFGLLAFRFSPRPCFAWRRGLLRCFGAKIGRSVRTYPSTTVYFPWNLTVGDYSSFGEDVLIYNLGPITVGNRVTVSQRAHLCAGSHDYRDPAMPLLKPPVRIEDDVWICADAFVGPNVTVHDRAIVAAAAVVVKDVASGTIVGGNPATYIKNR